MRQSHTAVVARNAAWNGPFATEPWEAAWAAEAIYFVRLLTPVAFRVIMQYSVEISPDGIHWVELSQGTFDFNEHNVLAYRQLKHFGGWLRLSGNVHCYATHPDQMQDVRFMAYLTLKS
ncbi:MAG: hypothetical protein F4Y08_07815 [Caldilineaceae bacterium SB0662_bin_9]|uniref:Discoidin domain-containing protein n=1 Tax=Caldilineaceae bacterium SB0662_bin_9 TaxID=2605258 RepID=A0A6B1DSM7_9CHLR|nr:hypothetical protein [Caldilineaceae bacterium]MYD90231.1 hypothetical protein [Caldilineaceae bacterium SB0662_bin_9]